jgi:integrase/recombinase XerC
MVESFLEYLQFEKRYSDHTLLSYRNDLRQFEEHLSRTTSNSLIQANFNDVRSWMVSMLGNGITANSVGRKMACLRSYYKHLLKEEVIRESPMQKIKSPKVKKQLPVFVQEDSMIGLLDHFQFTEDFSGMRDKLIMELLYGTGIRLSELIDLKESDVSFHSHTIKVLGKRNKERYIPINNSLYDLLKKYQAIKKETFPHNADDFLIVTDRSDQAYPMFIYRTVRKYLDATTTLEKKSPHVLRHTFATHLLNKGADLNAIKDLLGHANLAATQVYTHNSLEKIKEIFKQAHPKA